MTVDTATRTTDQAPHDPYELGQWAAEKWTNLVPADVQVLYPRAKDAIQRRFLDGVRDALAHRLAAQQQVAS